MYKVSDLGRSRGNEWRRPIKGRKRIGRKFESSAEEQTNQQKQQSRFGSTQCTAANINQQMQIGREWADGSRNGKGERSRETEESGVQKEESGALQ
jgi:hypothetical protein